VSIEQPETIVDVGEEADSLLLFKPEIELRTPPPALTNYASVARPQPRRVKPLLVFACGLMAGASSVALISHAYATPDDAMLPRVESSPIGAHVNSLPPSPGTPDLPPPRAVDSFSPFAPSRRAARPPQPAAVVRGVEAAAAAGYHGTLSVESQPAGARVFINNEYAGETPLRLRNLPVGSRAVLLRLDGYHPWSRGVRVVANEPATVAAQLAPLNEPD
jgi:hypothetical protein